MQTILNIFKCPKSLRVKIWNVMDTHLFAKYWMIYHDPPHMSVMSDKFCRMSVQKIKRKKKLCPLWSFTFVPQINMSQCYLCHKCCFSAYFHCFRKYDFVIEAESMKIRLALHHWRAEHFVNFLNVLLKYSIHTYRKMRVWQVLALWVATKWTRLCNRGQETEPPLRREAPQSPATPSLSAAVLLPSNGMSLFAYLGIF